MVSPGTALPSLSGSGNESLLVAVIEGATARAAGLTVARETGVGAPARPAPTAAGARGDSSEPTRARERNVPSRDFRWKAILNAFGFMEFSYRGWWLGVPSQTRAW